jgi:hypothetical protein
MKTKLSSTDQNREAGVRARFWFSLVAFGFVIGLLVGHLLFHP